MYFDIVRIRLVSNWTYKCTQVLALVMVPIAYK